MGCRKCDALSGETWPVSQRVASWPWEGDMRIACVEMEKHALGKKDRRRNELLSFHR